LLTRPRPNGAAVLFVHRAHDVQPGRRAHAIACRPSAAPRRRRVVMNGCHAPRSKTGLIVIFVLHI
jgi:hypothetical protein